MNYRNDLDEYLIFSFFYMPSFRILFFGLPNLLSHFNILLSTKVPKLLENWVVIFLNQMVLNKIIIIQLKAHFTLVTMGVGIAYES